MTPAGEILRDEIARSGPVTFHRFIQVALYHPVHGYYRRGSDPFGKAGDYYTAEQVQPVFGILIAAYVRQLFGEMEAPEDCMVVELGAGRAEMAGAFAGLRYLPVDVDRGRLPGSFRGVLFANEFFDALPVHLVVRRGTCFREMLVGLDRDRYRWVEGETAGEELCDYLVRYAAPAGEGDLLEVSLEALRWMERIAVSLLDGYLLVIDYGYTAAEVSRFPAGTLMSYRRHAASDDVLAGPGERDITAHVCFTALQRHGASRGLDTVRFESLARLLLRAGEADQFAAALAAGSQADAVRRRLQLKSLLFGMGESFRSLLMRKAAQK